MLHISRRTARPGLAAFTALCVAGAGAATLTGAGGAQAAAGAQAADKPHYTKKIPISRGYGGAVTSVDPEASKVGIEVLRAGGNAVDAAVATAAALGVTEPYSAGIGGGGFFLYYDADTREVHTLDGRETAPRAMPRDAFIDPETGKPYPFTPDLVTSGVSVGVPGTPATWARALKAWGTYDLRRALKPAARLADRGFVVDETFAEQTEDNQIRFEAYTTTPDLFLPGGEAPEVGSVFENDDLADTYRLLGRKGVRPFYRGKLAREIVASVQDPPRSPTTDLPVMPGFMKRRDLKRYRAKFQDPTHSDYRGYSVYGMAPVSSGGSTVGESLNILEQFNLLGLGVGGKLHRYLEATALAFADRAAYLGDPAYVDVPLRKLLSDKFARERACEIDPKQAATKPVAAGDVDHFNGRCSPNQSGAAQRADTENVETTNLTVADKWGNVVEYTLTIEQTGGSGLLVKDRGFLLNNELTDFSLVYDPDDPNRIQGGKRPRSSIAPTIVLKRGKPFLALGSPGGSTIITTVTQILFNRIDRRMPILKALAEPRASQRNTATVTAEPAFIAAHGKLESRFGHDLVPAGDALTSAAEIGAATAIQFRSRGRLTAVAEPERRGGGSALVVSKRPRG